MSLETSKRGFDMDAQDLKEYISRNPEWIEKILESIGCHKIKDFGKEYRCALPEDTNGTRVVVNKESLYCRIYDKKTIKGDIYLIIGEIKNLDFINSLKYCHQILGIKYDGKFKKKDTTHPLDKYRRIKRKYRKAREGEIKEFELGVLDKFIRMPHYNFFQDGITPQIQREFNVCYSPEHERIVIPHFKWDDKTKIVGLVGRTTCPDWDLLEIPKYWNLITGYIKGQNLYGLSHNIEHIKKQGVVKVFESEKAVMQLATMGDRTGVAVGSHEITKIQRRLLIQLGVEIVICFDKDVEEEFVQETAEYFTKYRKTSYVYDNDGLLGSKDSPTDRGYKIWSQLYENRKKIS